MKTSLYITILAAMCAAFLSGCATTFDQASSQFPKLAANEGRIYFYRENKFIGSGANTTIILNDQALRALTVGSFFYVDRPPGNYAVGCRTGWMDINQGKDKLTFTLAPSETKYVSIAEHFGVLTADAVPNLEDRETAMKTLPKCIYSAYK